MIAPDLGLRADTRADPVLRGIDHIGIAIRDLGAEVAAWRAQGFLVSDPVALFSTEGGVLRPLGQTSAHVIFANGYVELSAPVPGAGNHLEPYLAAAGEGVRILVHATDDIAGAQAACPDSPAPRLSTRMVALPGAAVEARFLWFPLALPTLPDVLCAVVAHQTPDVVYHPALWDHPNGLTQIAHLIAAGTGVAVRDQGLPPTKLGVQILAAQGDAAGVARISGLVLRNQAKGNKTAAGYRISR